MGLEAFKGMMAARLQGVGDSEQRRAAQELLGEEFPALDLAFTQQMAAAATSVPEHPTFEPQKVVSWQGEALWSSLPYDAEQDTTFGPAFTSMVRQEAYQRGATWRLLRVPVSYTHPTPPTNLALTP